YGHRRDPDGYGEALETFDRRLPEILEKLREDDLLFITADHGNDPTFRGTDHTRELVPLFAYHKQIQTAGALGLRGTFADIAATISNNYKVTMPKHGESFKKKLILRRKGGFLICIVSAIFKIYFTKISIDLHSNHVSIATKPSPKTPRTSWIATKASLSAACTIRFSFTTS